MDAIKHIIIKHTTEVIHYCQWKANNLKSKTPWYVPSTNIKYQENKQNIWKKNPSILQIDEGITADDQNPVFYWTLSYI